VDKYARQRGLVSQDVIADAHVTVCGTGPALPYLLQCLALMGAGSRYGSIRLCGADRLVENADVADQFLLKREDIGRPLGQALADRVTAMDDAIDITAVSQPQPRSLIIAVPTEAEVTTFADTWPVGVWGQVLNAAVYVGPEPLHASGGTGRTILSTALAAICGGLLAQAALRQLGALISGPAVLSSWLEERLWLCYPGLGSHAKAAMADMAAMTDGPIWPALDGVIERACPAEIADHFRVLRDGNSAAPRVTSVIDDDAVLVSVQIKEASAVASMVTVHPNLAAPGEVVPLLWSPFEGVSLESGLVKGDDITLPELMPPLHLVVCGAGALGSWATAIIAASHFPEVAMCLVDMDDTIEAHNLNRQVLFGETDIGQPKVRQARRRLSEIDPAMRLQALQVKIDPILIGELTGGQVGYEIIDETLLEERSAYLAQINALTIAFSDASAVLSCPDNHQTRWSLNVIAEKLGIPLVNGAMEGFTGRVHVCDPRDSGGCLVCWLGTSIARDVERNQCTGLWDDEPVPSIVTSAAVVGACQAATLIAALAGTDRQIQRFHVIDGRSETLAGYRGPDRDPGQCPAHLFTAQDELAADREPSE
jgi:molybdopterin/thiamine biosynthesis adenylyltransferase